MPTGDPILLIFALGLLSLVPLVIATVDPHPVQDSSMLSVLAACDGLMIRPPHDPARKAGDIVQVVDLASLPGGY